MSKPTYLGANVEISTHTFSHLIGRTNQMIYDMGTVVLTAQQVTQPNTTNGALTVGNAALDGNFQSNVISVTGSIRGGTVSVPAPLSVVSNTVFSGVETIFENNVRLGNQTSDLISVTGRVDTPIRPNVDATHDFGGSSLRWRDSYFRYVDAARLLNFNILQSSEDQTAYVITKASTESPRSFQVRVDTPTTQVTSLVVNNTAVRSGVDDTIDLGSNNYRWKTVWSYNANVQSNLVVGGTSTLGAIVNSSSPSVNVFSSPTSITLGDAATAITVGGGTTMTLNIGKTATATANMISHANTFTITTAGTSASNSISIGTGAWAGQLNLARPSARVNILTTTDATNLTTAGVVVSGGVSIAKKLIVGAAAELQGNLAVAGATTLTGALTGTTSDFSGNARVRGTLTVDGDLVLTNSDISLTVNQAYQNTTRIYDSLDLTGASVNSDLIPNVHKTRSIGSAARAWNVVFANEFRVSSNAAGYTIFKNNNNQATNNEVILPSTNLSLRGGTGAVLEDKFTDLSASTADELRGKVTGTTGTSSLVFASNPLMTSPILQTSLSLRNGTTTTRTATITNTATANTAFTLPTVNGQLATTNDIGTGSISINAGTGISGSLSFGLNDSANGTVTIANTDRGSTQNIFKNIANSAGATQFSAGTNNDSIRFEAGTGLSLVFVAASKTIRFSSDLTGGDGVNVTNGATVSVDSSVVRTSRTISANDGLMGGGNLSGNIGFAVDSSVVRTSRTLGNGWGINAIGNLSANRTISANQTDFDARYALRTIQINAGDGMSGTGGNLGSNINLSVDSTVLRTTGNQRKSGNLIIESQLEVHSANAYVLGRKADGTNKYWLYSQDTSDATRLRVYNVNGDESTEYLFWATGILQAPSFQGVGSSLTALNASNVTLGTLADARIPSNIVRNTISITASNGLVGGGTLSTTRSLSVGQGVGIRVNASDVAVMPGNGLTANTTGVHIVAGVGLNVNSANIWIGEGDGITVSTNAVAVDSTVVRTSGTQNIGGSKTFTSTINAPTFNSTSVSGGAFLGNTGDSLTTTSFTWNGDVNTGMFRHGDGVIGFACNGTLGGRIAAGGFYGVGRYLENLNASELGVGTVPQERLNNVRGFISDMSDGSVGTYAYLKIVGTTDADHLCSPGATRPGSKLRYSNAGGRLEHGSTGPFTATGTWRCMGFASNWSGNGSQDVATLWLRIS